MRFKFVKNQSSHSLTSNKKDWGQIAKLLAKKDTGTTVIQHLAGKDAQETVFYSDGAS